MLIWTKNAYFVTAFGIKIKNIAEKYVFSGIDQFFIHAWSQERKDLVIKNLNR